MSTRVFTRRSGLWAALLVVGILLPAGLKEAGVIDPMTAYVLLAGAMLLAIPMVRAMAAERRDCASDASARYGQRMAIVSFFYVLGLGAAILIDKSMSLGTTGLVLLALLPAAPIFAMVWVMGRYLVEEQDEYQRHLAILSAVIGLGVVLVAGTFWGFLEMFRVVPHVESWWIIPVWAIGMGLGRGAIAMSSRRAVSE